MTNFASSALYNLAVQQLGARGYAADTLKKFGGKIDAGRKRALLDDAMAAVGPRAVLSIGQGIKEAPFDPTLAVLRRAVTPSDLIERWTRLERYHHGNHRVRIISAGRDFLSLEHHAVSGEAPSVGEDLIIAGLLAALLEEVGCHKLTLSVSGITGAVIDEGVVQHDLLFSGARCARWDYAWAGFQRTPSDPPLSLDADAVTERVDALISDDPGRGWQLGTVSESLGMSKRSLQRSLATEGDTFQKLLRRARTTAASKALLERKQSFAEIGYASGFSDQAHFTREFKARFNMTPKAYSAFADTT